MPEFAVSLLRTHSAYRSQELDRDVYWKAMARHHTALRDYQALLRGGVVRKIEIGDDDLRIETRSGVRMIWAPEDIRSAPNVAVNHAVYEAAESPFLMHAASGSKLIFDIGANAGWYSLHFAQASKVQGRPVAIHAFEPVPSTYSFLARNVALNGLSDIIRANNFGLAEAVKDLTIFLPGFSGSGAASLCNLHPEETSQQIPCHFETLDLYARANGLAGADLIKVDVEGAELMVLQGGLDLIGRDRPILFMELLRKWSAPFGYHPNDVFSLCRGLGYRIYAIREDQGRPSLLSIEKMTDETEETNFAFLVPGTHDWALAPFTIS